MNTKFVNACHDLLFIKWIVFNAFERNTVQLNTNFHFQLVMFITFLTSLDTFGNGFMDFNITKITKCSRRFCNDNFLEFNIARTNYDSSNQYYNCMRHTIFSHRSSLSLLQ
ncbi:hypothetical protein AAHE18_03G189600 [Arachis hypogaea]